MLLAVDIGNTKIKAAVFEDNALIEKIVFEKPDAVKKIENIFSQYKKISSSILSSVGKDDFGLLELLGKNASLTIIDKNFNFPYQNKYSTPHTLGIDRMVLAGGAVLQHPVQNRLIMDAGTCITYDFIDADDNYLGGAISPGLMMRYEAMHTFTAKLPLLYPKIPGSFIGDSTASSMHSGAVNGLVYEIEGFIKRYEESYGRLTTILTGGDADFLAKRLKNTIFANSNFLLESLSNLYSYNNQK